MVEAITAALKLEDKLLDSEAPLAVFARGGKWKAVKTNTASYDAHCRKAEMDPFAMQLIGVYTAAVRLEDIVEDLAAAGIR